MSERPKIHHRITDDLLLASTDIDDAGYCIACGECVACDERDARERPCPACGNITSVYAAEELLQQGLYNEAPDDDDSDLEEDESDNGLENDDDFDEDTDFELESEE